MSLACTACGAPLAAVPPAPGFLAPRWGHAVPPPDGHEPGVPPVTVTYTHDRGSWDAECAEVPGFPVRAAVSLEQAKAVAWVLLGKILPARPVIERVPEA
jgi:hypothetical protein